MGGSPASFVPHESGITCTRMLQGFHFVREGPAVRYEQGLGNSETGGLELA